MGQQILETHLGLYIVPYCTPWILRPSRLTGSFMSLVGFQWMKRCIPWSLTETETSTSKRFDGGYDWTDRLGYCWDIWIDSMEHFCVAFAPKFVAWYVLMCFFSISIWSDSQMEVGFAAQILRYSNLWPLTFEPPVLPGNHARRMWSFADV